MQVVKHEYIYVNEYNLISITEHFKSHSNQCIGFNYPYMYKWIPINNACCKKTLLSIQITDFGAFSYKYLTDIFSPLNFGKTCKYVNRAKISCTINTQKDLFRVHNNVKVCKFTSTFFFTYYTIDGWMDGSRRHRWTTWVMAINNIGCGDMECET